MKNNQFNLQTLLESGDKEGLYNCVLPTVRFVVSTRLRGCAIQDSEDIISDVIVKLFDKDCSALRSVREYPKFYSWLVTVAVNATRDYFRRKKITLSLDYVKHEDGRTLHDVLSGSVPDPMDTLAWEEIHSRVWSKINALSARYQDVVRDKFVRHLSVPEIAVRRGIEESTVYVRLMRAFGQLRPELEEFRDPAVR